MFAICPFGDLTPNFSSWVWLSVKRGDSSGLLASNRVLLEESKSESQGGDRGGETITNNKVHKTLSLISALPKLSPSIPCNQDPRCQELT